MSEKNNFFESKLFGIIILATTGLVVLVFVFGLGVFVGTKKAEFSFQWADEYHKNFGGPQGGFFGDMMGQNFTEANGVFGQIIKIADQTLTIQGNDNVEKNILITDKTTIVYQRKKIQLSELKLNDKVVVIGDPDSQGQIQAELIRVMNQNPVNIPTVTPK